MGRDGNNILGTERMEDFIKKLEAEFEELESGKLQPDTSFRDIEEWSSMHSLILIALVDVEYGVTITGEDLQQMNTVQDLYSFVQANIA